MNKNLVFIVGRLSMNPMLKSYVKKDGSEGARCFFRVAVTREMDRGNKQDERRTNWIPVVAWGNAAKRHAQYLQKGSQVTITGELICENIRKEDGSFEQLPIYVNADDVQYGQRSSKNQPAASSNDSARIAALEQQIASLAAGRTTQPTGEPTDTSAGETPVAEAGRTPFDD